MAGSYPDVPSRRMAWDDDGSLGLWRKSGDIGVSYTTLTQWSAADITELNDEDNVNITSGPVNTTGSDRSYVSVLFPELREIDGVMIKTSTTGARFAEVEVSTDTTNTIDGSFATLIADWPDADSADVYGDYRDDIQSVASSNRRAVRGNMNNAGGGTVRMRAIHLYGEISASETPDRLLWFDQPSALEFALPIDYGDVPRGSAEDRVTFLKNNSASLTASTVQVTGEALYLGSGAWYTYDEGTGFTSTLSLASSIANGANSPNITIRRIIPDAEVLGLHAARSQVSVGSWA